MSSQPITTAVSRAVDPRFMELAQSLVSDHVSLSDRVVDLAAHLQDQAEDWIAEAAYDDSGDGDDDDNNDAA